MTVIGLLPWTFVALSFSALSRESIDLKRQQFEKDRLPLNQEYCSHFEFFHKNGSFPEINEMGWTYWQAERLTAIEGRLYGEALEAGWVEYAAAVSELRSLRAILC